MSLMLASPGLLSDEEECGAVFESTATDVGYLLRPQRFGAPLPEISVISPAIYTQVPAREMEQQVKTGLDRGGSGDEGTEKLKVYLRVRPLMEGEKERGEEQGCVSVQTAESLLLRAPKDSHNMKTAERGVTQSMHKFSFTQIFGADTTQQEFYESTMKEMVRDVLRGENRLLYTYGVTNSGKTYTITGAGGEAGLLPRALVSVFLKLSGRLYSAADLKPVFCQEVRRLEAGEIRVEELRRDCLLKEEEGSTSQQSRLRGGPSASWDSGIGGMSAASHIATQLEDSDGVCLEADGLCLSGGEELEEGVQFSVWVSYYEIYNEFLYDLLEAPPSLQLRKRATLRLSDDKHGNPYVKDLTWIQVRSAEEAWKVLKAGRRNQSFASTLLNHNSSRSHSIFSIRILHIQPGAELGQGTRISELSVCDLAGSERCKDQRNGERMKEASNINTSLHTLGRCISALRHNQTNRSRPAQVVPFRDSKLTRVLQGFFCGHGRSCMVVNINPCTSTYDETLQALKFSAIATQLVHGPSTKTRVAYILSLLREPPAHSNDSTLLEEEEESEEEGDLTMFDSEALLRAIEVLKGEVLRQRQEKEALEASVREEVCSEMMEVISHMQNDFSETLETERALMEERYENKINNLKTSLKKYYSQEMEERDEQIRELSEALGTKGKAAVAPAPIFPPLGDAEGPRRSTRLASTHGGDAGRLASTHGGDAGRLASTHGGDSARLASTHGGDAARLASTHGGDAARLASTHGGDAARLASTHGGDAARLASTHGGDVARLSAELEQCKAELEQCKAQLERCAAELNLRCTELQLKTLELRRFQGQHALHDTSGTLTATADRKLEDGQRNLRQLRADLQRLGLELQSGERACCRNTDGEKLRHALSSADNTLAKQDQMLVELHTSLQLVKADLRRKAELLAQFQSGLPASLANPAATNGSCKKRGCGAAAASSAENQPPQKQPFFRSLFPSCTPSRTPQRACITTPYTRVLRSRQPSPPPTPSLLRRGVNL